MTGFWCNIWWVTLGATLGWIGYWLLDKFFRRDRDTSIPRGIETMSRVHSRAGLLQSRPEAARNTGSEHDAHVAGLASDVADLTSGRETDQSKLGRLQTVEDDARRAAAHYEDQINKLKVELVSASLKAKELDRLRGELTTAQKAAATAVGEMSKLKSDLSAETAKAEAAAKQLLDDLQAAKAKSAAAEKSLADLNAKLSAAEGKAEDAAKLRSDLSNARSKQEAAAKALGLLEDETGASKQALTAAANEISRLKADLAAAERKASAIEQLTGELEIERRRAGAAEAKLQHVEVSNTETIAAQEAASDAAANAGFRPKRNGRDDLTIIEGIGPKIAKLLASNGIASFQALSETPVPELQSLINAGGPNFKLANPASWPRQAKLAAGGDWQGLRTYQDELIAGVKPSGPAS